MSEVPAIQRAVEVVKLQNDINNLANEVRALQGKDARLFNKIQELETNEQKTRDQMNVWKGFGLAAIGLGGAIIAMIEMLPVMGKMFGK